MPMDFFQANLGNWVLRKDPVDADYRTYLMPENPKAVTLFHSLQEHGIRFKPMLRIHSGPIECESCSA